MNNYYLNLVNKHVLLLNIFVKHLFNNVTLTQILNLSHEMFIILSKI